MKETSARGRDLPLDFDPETLPWIDQADADIEAYLGERVAKPERELRRAQLKAWREQGYLILEDAVSSELIDAYLADVDSLCGQHGDYPLLVNCESRGVAPICELTPDELEQPQLRFLDFHNASTAGKRLGLASPLVSFLGHALGDDVVAMQSLTFLCGTGQSLHQDFAYVVASIPSHLAACWIALEDVHADAGPVGYYPGSHRLPKFDFGNGLFLTEKSPRREGEFAEHLESEAQKSGLSFERLMVKKGDVLIWHSSLAHAGTPIVNPALTRKSVAFHYSTAAAYPHDRRRPGEKPSRFELNGACCYGDDLRAQFENCFTASGAW